MIWKRFVQIVLLTIILLVGFISFLLFTNDGLKFVLQLGELFVPGDLHITRVEGNLIRGFTLKQIYYEDKSMALTATDFNLHWRPLSLFKGELHLDQLDFSHLQLIIYDPKHAHKAKHSRLIDIKQFTANSIVENHRSYLQAQWQHFFYHMNDENTIKIPKGQFDLSGRTDNYQFKLRTYVDFSHLPDGYWTIQGHGNRQSTIISHFSSGTKTDLLMGSGKITWKSQPEWQIKLLAKQVNAHDVWPTLQGQFNAELSAYHQPNTTKITLNKLSGQLNKQDLQGHGSVLIQGDNYLLQDINLHAGSALLRASGQWPLSQAKPLTWEINVPDFKQLTMNGYGRLVSQATLYGPYQSAKINGKIAVDNFGLGAEYIKQLDADFNIHLKPNAVTEAHVKLTDFSYKGNYLSKLNITLSGNTTEHHLQIQIDKDQQSLATTLIGQLTDLRWKVKLQQLSLSDPTWGQWTNNRSSSITISPGLIKLTKTCLQSKPAQLCSQFDWHSAKQWAIDINARHIDLSKLDLYLPPGNKIQTEASFNLFAKHSTKTSHAKLDLLLSPGRLIYQRNGHQQTVALASGFFRSQLDKQGLRNNLDIRLAEQQRIKLTLNLPKQTAFNDIDINQPINGNINVALKKLGLLLLTTSEVDSDRGSLLINTEINGVLRHPQLYGHAKLNINKLFIPTLGISINDIKLHAQGHRQGNITLTMTSSFGTEKLSIDGNTELQATPITSTLSLSGNKLLVANTNQYKVYISPNLTIKKINKKISITGDIKLPSVNINTVEQRKQTVQLPQDTVITQNDSELNQNTSSLALSTDINLLLGDDVKVSMLGLSARLDGQLRIFHQPKSPTNATGDIKIIDGRYQAYGQNLTIQQGQLLFTGGPVDNPGLNIRAVRRIDSVPVTQNNNLGNNLADIDAVSKTQVILPGQQSSLLVGIHVRGQLRDPDISLYSEPATYSQSDILSYLLLGRPLSSANNSDAQTLYSAASALNLAGAELTRMNQSLQNQFQLDEISVKSRPLPTTLRSIDATDRDPLNENTSLILGKALSPNLYVNYSIGLLRPINILTVKLMLNSSWSIQSETSSLGNGLDLFYSIEK